MTIELGFAVLCAAALIGGLLALIYLRGPTARRPHPAVSAIHGVAGATGFALLLAALGHSRLSDAMGTAGFGPASAGLLGLALALGVAIGGAALRGRRAGGALVGAHAGFAIAGLVVLLALISFG